MAEKETRHQAYLTVYFCGSENCPPRHAYGPAVRPHYLLHVILKGRGIYQYKGQTYALSAGDAFLIPPEVTYYQADEREPGAMPGWVLTEKRFLRFSPDCFSEAFVFRKETPDSIAPLTDQMKKLCETFSRVRRTSSPPPEISCCSFPLRKKALRPLRSPPRSIFRKPKNIWKTIMLIPSGFPTWPAIPALTGPISTGSSWKKRSSHPNSTCSATGFAWPLRCSAPPATPSPRSPSPAASTTPLLFPAVFASSFICPPEISGRPYIMSRIKTIPAEKPPIFSAIILRTADDSKNPIDESGKRAPPVLWPNGHIFLYTHEHNGRSLSDSC